MLTDITERDVPKGASLSLSSGKGKKVFVRCAGKRRECSPLVVFLRELRRSARSLGRFGLDGGGTCVGQGGHAAFRRCRPSARGKGPRCTHAPAEKQRESSGRHGASKAHSGQDVLSSALLRDPAAAGTACAGHSATLGVQKASGRILRGASKAGEGVALSVQKTRCGEHGFLRTRLFPTQ